MSSTSIPKREKELYPSIRDWLKTYLKGKYDCDCRVWVSANRALSTIIEEAGITSRYPQFDAFDFQVDIVGVYGSANSPRLAFIEVKYSSATLRDLGQLLGYSIVAKPDIAILLSPQGPNNYLLKLLKTYERTDALNYDTSRGTRRIAVAKWDMSASRISLGSVIPAGTLS